MKKVEQPIAAMVLFAWVGFVCAISFLEAWLKFQAPGVTLAIGLGIGRLVFNALNKIEWVFAFAVIISTIRSYASVLPMQRLLLALIFLILILQTFWLLPGLDKRALLHINGQKVLPSNLHFYFIVAELTKTICLMIYGFKLFKRV